MMDNVKLLIPLVVSLVIWTCNRTPEQEQETEALYLAEIGEWRADRLAGLKAPDGWPALAGLYRLKEGENTFGSGKDNDLVFPGHAPGRMGAFFLSGDSLVTHIAQGVTVRIGDSVVTEVRPPQSDTATLELGSLFWHPIERGGQYFIRLRDTLNAARQELEFIPHFPVDPAWRIRAEFIPFDPPETIPVRNVLDMDISQDCEGKFRFEWQGEPQEIWALDGGPDEYFLIFADETTGAETYGGGRYMYVARPDSTGHSILDFNKAYNPPCVFTAYATCLLPPAQNRLSVAVRAGELMYGEEH